MGYESKFYVVEKSGLFDNEIDYTYASVVAMFDLCKVPSVYDRIKNYPKTEVYFYADDGNTKVIEDKCGDALIEIPVEDMISILEDVISKEDYYRRFNPFLMMLKGFDLSKWRDLVVLHYGH